MSNGSSFSSVSKQRLFAYYNMVAALSTAVGKCIEAAIVCLLQRIRSWLVSIRQCIEAAIVCLLQHGSNPSRGFFQCIEAAIVCLLQLKLPKGLPRGSVSKQRLFAYYNRLDSQRTHGDSVSKQRLFAYYNTVAYHANTRGSVSKQRLFAYYN